MNAHATITRPAPVMAKDRVDAEPQPERADLRQRIERLLRKIFEGHEDFLGVTPD
jgi:hypothetical protein